MSIFAQVYTDEDVAGLVATLLKSRGISATSTPEQRQIGKSDEEQLAFAAENARRDADQKGWNTCPFEHPYHWAGFTITGYERN